MSFADEPELGSSAAFSRQMMVVSVLELFGDRSRVWHEGVGEAEASDRDSV